jgi:hypothetical protein
MRLFIADGSKGSLIQTPYQGPIATDLGMGRMQAWPWLDKQLERDFFTLAGNDRDRLAFCKGKGSAGLGSSFGSFMPDSINVIALRRPVLSIPRFLLPWFHGCSRFHRFGLFFSLLGRSICPISRIICPRGSATAPAFMLRSIDRFGRFGSTAANGISPCIFHDESSAI